MYYRLVIWHIDLITKLRPGDNCHGWSATIPWMVNHHPKDKDGHPASPGWSPISLRLVTHYSKSPSQILSPASQGWSPMIPSMVTHHPKLLKSDKTLQLQLNKEFDTSTAQLVSFIVHSANKSHHEHTKLLFGLQAFLPISSKYFSY